MTSGEEKERERVRELIVILYALVTSATTYHHG
jgi:hypothetical protein